MHKTLLGFLAGICISASALAQGPRPLDDAELATVSGRDGISIMVDLRLNQAALTDPAQASYLSLGFKGVDSKTNYLVFKNPHGALFIGGITIDMGKRTDGGSDYVAVGLPGHLMFGNVGFDSLNAQDNPLTVVPFNETLGGLNINGKMSMTGQLRLWTH